MSDHTDAVTLNYTVTRSDVYDALVRTTICRLWFMLFLPVFGAAGTIWAVVDPANGAVTISSGLTMFAIGIVLFLVLPYLQANSAMKAPNFGAPVGLTVSGAGIEYAGAHSDARLDWTVTKGVAETKQTILINLKPAGFLIIPKRDFAPADTAALRNVLRKYAPGNIGLFKE